MSYLVFLIIISGVIAYIGSFIGRYFGRKHWMLFGLRPRHSAYIFTVISGILVMAITFSTLIFVSRDVRIALFGMEQLNAQIQQGQKDVQTARAQLETIKLDLEKVQKQKEELNKLKENLGKQVAEQKSKTVVYKAGQILSISKFFGGQSIAAADSQLKGLLNKIDSDAKKFQINDVEVNKQDFESTLSYLVNMEGETVVKIVSERNVVAGGTLSVTFDVLPNSLVFKKDEQIISSEISGKLSAMDIEKKLSDLVSQTENLARSKGILPNLSGEVLALSESELYSASRRIKGYAQIAKVKVLAAKDAYAIGPLLIKFEIEI